MATSGKKSKKQKWKSMPLTENTSLPRKTGTSSWADEMDDDHEYGRKVDNLVLPTAPRAARANEDDSKIPHEPPFLAYLTNLPYEVNEEELTSYFNDLKINVKIKSVSLPKEDRTNKYKGYGYVEFEDRVSFVSVLNITDTTIKNRRMRIEVAQNHGDSRSRGMRSGGSDSDYMNQDWRSGPSRRDDDDGYRSGGRRGDYGGSGGGFGRRDDRRGGFGDRDRERGGSGFNREGRPGGFGREERGEWQPGSGGGGSSSGNWRDGDRGGSDRDRDRGGERDNRGGFGRSGFEERRTDYNWRKDNRDREPDRDFDRERERERDGPPPERSDMISGEPKTRPRIALIPRTKPIEVDKKEADASAAIFGGAKPVDTAAREREIEERLARQSGASSEDHPKRKGPSSQDSWDKDRDREKDRDRNHDKERDGGGGGSDYEGKRDRNQDFDNDRDYDRDDRDRDCDSREEEKSTPREEERRSAEPPKENVWALRAQHNSTVNNGRSSPLEDSETLPKSRGSSPPRPSKEEPSGGEPVRKYQPPRGQGPDSRRGDRRGPPANDERGRSAVSGNRDGGRGTSGGPAGSGSARSSNAPAKGSSKEGPSRPRFVENEQTSEPKKDDRDEVARMPKYQEQKAPVPSEISWFDG